jgi:putative tributyrin esterase
VVVAAIAITPIKSLSLTAFIASPGKFPGMSMRRKGSGYSNGFARIVVLAAFACLPLSQASENWWHAPAVALVWTQSTPSQGGPWPPASPQTPSKSSGEPSQLAAVRQVLQAASLDGAELPYRVFVPANYGKTDRRYAVLYLLHGLSGDENDWWQRTHLPEYAARYQLIIVMPGVGDTWYANSASNPKARYESVIVSDLIPYIDAHYRTIAGPEGRAIAGLSMGGLGAMKFALRYARLFAFAGSFSGALDVPRTARLGKSPSARMLKDLQAIFGNENSETRRENDVFWLLDQAKKERVKLPYLYLSSGRSDPLPQVSESNPRFAKALSARKVRFEYNERPGAHDWQFWDSEINLMLGRMCVIMRVICS